MTKNKIELIKKIIQEHMSVIMSLTTGGVKKPSPNLLKQLGLPKDITDLITDSYTYGKLNVLSGKNLNNLSTKEVEKLLRDVKLTSSQKRSVEFARINAQQHLDVLQSKIVSNVVNLALNDQINMYNTVKQVVPDAIRDNTDRYEVIHQLREKSKDWERDWHRVAHTEMWNAKINGEANAIIENESPLSKKGIKTRVFKRPAPNACPMCKKLYLEKNGKKPIVWDLDELMANGTNYGKKQSEWKATLGTLHPNCMCPLSVLPDGYHLDDEGVMKPD